VKIEVINGGEEDSTRENVKIRKDLREMLVAIDKMFNKTIARL